MCAGIEQYESTDVPVQLQHTCVQETVKGFKAVTLCVQALSSMRGLRGLGVSQCSGVTGEALGQLLPSLPACTRLTLNCLHLTDDHMDMLAKVLTHATPPGFCATFPACNSALGSVFVWMLHAYCVWIRICMWHG